MDDDLYMGMALEQAREAAAADEAPIGAVVVYQPRDPATRKPLAAPRVVSRGRNCREELADPAAHAEFCAVEDAARALGRWRLSGCTVYVTLEPCAMCAGLMVLARVDRCVFGAPDPKGGALGSLYRLNDDPRLNHSFPVTSGVREQECAAVLHDYFAAKRARAKAEKRARKAADGGTEACEQPMEGPGGEPGPQNARGERKRHGRCGQDARTGAGEGDL